tara:strand:- start:40 stop:630 length:591 start_codon:yes stop_codon:yes gene_type:complete
MDKENKNLELWNRVEKTDPKHTKDANVGGNKITSIAPQYQIMNATREFGVYGSGWGFKSLCFDYGLADKFNVVTLNAVFFYPNGEFPIVSSIKMYKDNAMTKVDDDFAKKVETDTLTKALSKLGFNADVFMGRFDDTKYVNERKAEFKVKAKLTKEGYDFLIKEGTAEQIKEALNNRLVTLDQEVELLKLGEKLNK